MSYSNDYTADVVVLYERSTSEVIRRYAALEIAVGGAKSVVLVVKNDLPNASSLLRLAILCPSNQLCKDERRRWKLANQVYGVVEKCV